MPEDEDEEDEEDWFEAAFREGTGEDSFEDSESDPEPPDADEPEDMNDDSLFEEDFSAAFEGGGDPAAASSGDPFAGGADVGEPGSDDPFGGGLEDGGDEGPGGEPPAFGGGEDQFADEGLESEIPRIKLGIDGLDEMIRGGVPERSLIVTIGGAGTGKTTFGLQFLNRGLTQDENCVYITLEESYDRIVTSASEKGWDFESYVEDGQLAIVDIDPIEMANSLQSIRGELPRLVEDFDADRLVLDSVSLLEMMYDDQATRRTEVYDFTKALKRSGVTTMLTSEASEQTPFASRFGIIEYLTDAVIVLRYVRPEDFRETRLAVEIQKIRDASHSRETKPYDITDEGIAVYQQANIF